MDRNLLVSPKVRQVVVKSAMTRGFSEEDAEDGFQQAVCDLLTTKGDVDNTIGWLKETTRRNCIEMRRREKLGRCNSRSRGRRLGQEPMPEDLSIRQSIDSIREDLDSLAWAGGSGSTAIVRTDCRRGGKLLTRDKDTPNLEMSELLQEVLWKIFDSMPMKSKEAFEYVCLRDFSASEYARELSLPFKTAHTRSIRARHQLQGRGKLAIASGDVDRQLFVEARDLLKRHRSQACEAQE